MNKIHIVGGGIIGLFSAYYLKKEGFDITIIDSGEIKSGCSFGNAGMITPSHFIPLASPGAIAKGIRWMFKSSSPFYIRPRLDLNLLQWMWQFYRSSNRRHVLNTAPFMADFQLFSRALYQNLATIEYFDFGFKEDGILMMARSERGFHEMIELSNYATELGIAAQQLQIDGVRKFEPIVSDNVIGGIHFSQDAHMDPEKLVLFLFHKLEEMGVKFMLNQNVTNFKNASNKITHLVLENGNPIDVERILICSGSWTPKLVKMLGIKMLLQGGKGYSITTPKLPNSPRIPAILEEAAVAVTPMGNKLRIGGSLEISGMHPNINRKRAEAVISSTKDYYQNLEIPAPGNENIWFGFRPCSADGLPFLGKYPQYKNLYVATGHAMQGMSLGPATGLLVSELISGKKPSLPIDLLKPDRF